MFKNLTTKLPIEATLDELELYATNLRNTTYGKDLFGKANLTELPLTALNPFADEYANFDFQKGTSHVFLETVTRKGALKGYVKLILEKVDVVDWEKEKKDSLLRLLWESMIGGVFEILENQKNERFAVRVPISAEVGKETDVGVWESVKSIFRNAFIKAMPKEIEKSLDFKSLKKKLI